MEKNGALSVDRCRLQAQMLKFSVHLINLLNMHLRCNGFAKIEKAVVHQIGSRPPSSDHGLFWCKFGFGKCFGAFFFFDPTPEPVIAVVMFNPLFIECHIHDIQEVIHCCVQ